MSRTTVHAFMAAVTGETIDDTVKDLYLNLCKSEVIADTHPWGASHFQTVETTDTINSTAATTNTQTEYAYPSTHVPLEIKKVGIRYDSSGAYITARRVDPFLAGDSEASLYTDQSNPVYFIRNNKIVVYPQFGSVVTAGIIVEMVENPIDISGTQTSTYVSNEFEKLWAYKAAEHYYTADNEEKRALTMRAGYVNQLVALELLAPVSSKYSDQQIKR
jgi:hypothetical protein